MQNLLELKDGFSLFFSFLTKLPTLLHPVNSLLQKNSYTHRSNHFRPNLFYEVHKYHSTHLFDSKLQRPNLDCRNSYQQIYSLSWSLYRQDQQL